MSADRDTAAEMKNEKCSLDVPQDLACALLSEGKTGLPGGTRTPDLLLRRQLLYPVELRAVWDVAVDLGIIQALQDGASLLYRRELR